MKFRYQLPDNWISVVAEMEEFANGGTQVSVRLRDKREFHCVLVSNSMYVIAARGHSDLPFAIEDIEEIFQTDDDKNPRVRGGWEFWDDWKGQQHT